MSLASLLNLRDVGGLRTGDGRVVRHGRLLRSATPYFLTPEDAHELVERLGVGTRIDLRGPDEVADGTSAHLAAVERHVAHVPLAAGGAWTQDLLVPDLADRVSGHYLRYLEHSPEAFVQIAGLVSAADAPVLVHCAAGKDRTGVVIALMLSAVGVLDSEIVDDYARTRDDLDRIIDQLGRAPGFAERMARLPAESQTADPASMARFLDRLREVHGGARAYLERQAGPDAVAALTDSLLCPDTTTAPDRSTP